MNALKELVAVVVHFAIFITAAALSAILLHALIF